MVLLFITQLLVLTLSRMVLVTVKDIFTIFKLGAAFWEWNKVGTDVDIPHCKYQVKHQSSPWFSDAYLFSQLTEINSFVCTNRTNLLQLKVQIGQLSQQKSSRRCNFFFNWHSLQARLKSHYKARSYRERSTKRSKHTGNLFRKKLQLIGVFQT